MVAPKKMTTPNAMTNNPTSDATPARDRRVREITDSSDSELDDKTHSEHTTLMSVH